MDKGSGWVRFKHENSLNFSVIWGGCKKTAVNKKRKLRWPTDWYFCVDKALNFLKTEKKIPESVKMQPQQL